MSRTPIVLALIALAIAMFVLVSSNGPSSEVQVENVSSADADLHEEEEHVEVAIQMGRIQRYYQKWWAAGRAENAELAKFYLHEMEEAMEVVSDGNVSNEGVYVSNFMRIYGEKAFEKLETMLKEEVLMRCWPKGICWWRIATLAMSLAAIRSYGSKEPKSLEFPDQEFLPLTAR